MRWEQRFRVVNKNFGGFATLQFSSFCLKVCDQNKLASDSRFFTFVRFRAGEGCEERWRVKICCDLVKSFLIVGKFTQSTLVGWSHCAVICGLVRIPCWWSGSYKKTFVSLQRLSPYWDDKTFMSARKFFSLRPNLPNATSSNFVKLK